MNEVYRQRPGIPARNVEGVMAVITPRSSEIHRLSGVAADIWERCGDAGATRAELIEALLGLYEISREALEADLDTFLGEATDKGILEVSRQVAPTLAVLPPKH